MTVKELFDLFNNCYPINTQDEWDNSGIYEFNSGAKLVNPILSLDINLDVIDFAISHNSNVIISHHPIFIDESDLKLKHIKLIFEKLKHYDISVISLHTCFDKNSHGTSYQIIKRLKDFQVFASQKSPYLFFGKAIKRISLKDLLQKIKTNLDIEWIKISSSKSESIDFEKKSYLKIAVVGGSGSSEIDTILKKNKIDYFITSEIKWYLWNRNKSDSFSILEIPHSVEKVFIKTIKEKFKEINFLEFFPNKINIY